MALKKQPIANCFPHFKTYCLLHNSQAHLAQQQGHLESKVDMFIDWNIWLKKYNKLKYKRNVDFMTKTTYTPI